MKTITTSKKYWLNWRDILKALLIAMITPVIFIFQQELDSGNFPSWKAIGMAAVSGAAAYLVKNFFTPAKTVVEPEKKDEPTV